MDPMRLHAPPTTLKKVPWVIYCLVSSNTQWSLGCFSPFADEWQPFEAEMAVPSGLGEAVDLNSTHWLVTGGLNDEEDYLANVQLYSKLTGRFEELVDMPLPLWDHCVARVKFHHEANLLLARRW